LETIKGAKGASAFYDYVPQPLMAVGKLLNEKIRGKGNISTPAEGARGWNVVKAEAMRTGLAAAAGIAAYVAGSKCEALKPLVPGILLLINPRAAQTFIATQWGSGAAVAAWNAGRAGDLASAGKQAVITAGCVLSLSGKVINFVHKCVEHFFDSDKPAAGSRLPEGLPPAVEKLVTV